jgi:hypothetical protein
MKPLAIIFKRASKTKMKDAIISIDKRTLSSFE